MSLCCPRIQAKRRVHGPWAELDPDQHPGGPLEPAQLHQDPGGQHPAICGRSGVGRMSHTLVAFDSDADCVVVWKWAYPCGPVFTSREGQSSRAISSEFPVCVAGGALEMGPLVLRLLAVRGWPGGLIPSQLPKLDSIWVLICHRGHRLELTGLSCQ